MSKLNVQFPFQNNVDIYNKRMIHFEILNFLKLVLYNNTCIRRQIIAA